MKKRLPSKTSNFTTLVDENSFYVDKTVFIKELESISDRYLFFLRPRRFGKSLLLSMLGHYYGIQHAERFDDLFGGYFIGKPHNQTPLRNSYHILNFNFSGIKTDKVDDVFLHFTNEISGAVKLFITKYNLFTDAETSDIFSHNDANSILRSLFFKLQGLQPGIKVYLFIDEYDHFTNELLAFNRERFSEIVSQNGWMRKFFEVIKQFMGEGVIDRFFATGVTPVTLDSMTSGFNVSKNLTLDARFHNMAGFTESEVQALISATGSETVILEIDNLVGDIRDWYNGSKFSVESVQKLYNPQILINFLDYFYAFGKYPAEMYDPSVASDYLKIKNQLSILKPKEANEVISAIIENEKIKDRITLQYNLESRFSRTDLISLLFYNGLLTINGAEGSIMEYVIPNYVVKTMYWEFLRQSFIEENLSGFNTDDLMEIFDEMRFEGKVTRLVNYIAELKDKISNRDLLGFRESNLKMLFLPVLNFANIYKINSEVEINRKYIDLYLKLQPEYRGKYSFILELKYMKKTEIEKYNSIKSEGIEQLNSYMTLKGLNKDKNLKAFLILFLNNKPEVIEIGQE
ncbi:ATP-binding protein [Ignavibacteriales bacterium]